MHSNTKHLHKQAGANVHNATTQRGNCNYTMPPSFRAEHSLPSCQSIPLTAEIYRLIG